jgi:hypothetical protein
MTAPLDYRALFRELYGRQPRGLPTESIEHAERILGFALPAPLLAFYAGCGAEESAMAAFNHFLMPDDLHVVDGRLVFCEENQRVCVWGALPSADEPLTEQGVVLRDGAMEWHSEQVGLGEFLQIMLYIQTVWGGYELAGIHHAPAQVLPHVQGQWLRAVRHNDLTVYKRSGVLIAALAGETFLTAGARTQREFDQLERELGFQPL